MNSFKADVISQDLLSRDIKIQDSHGSLQADVAHKSSIALFCIAPVLDTFTIQIDVLETGGGGGIRQ